MRKCIMAEIYIEVETDKEDMDASGVVDSLNIMINGSDEVRVKNYSVENSYEFVL